MESRLGQQSYWEETFQQEFESLEETEDYESSCESWFGATAQRKVDRLVLKFVPITAQVVDIGCGNGCSLESFKNHGFTKLVGIDYSEMAVKIAQNRVPEASISQADITTWHFSSPASPLALFHDKGTLDAFLLHPSHSLSQYTSAVSASAAAFDHAWLVVTSCNNTYEELISMFAEYTELAHVEDYPKLSFAGRQGSTLATVLFRVKGEEDLFR